MGGCGLCPGGLWPGGGGCPLWPGVGECDLCPCGGGGVAGEGISNDGDEVQQCAVLLEEVKGLPVHTNVCICM